MRNLPKKVNLISQAKLTGVITLLACLFFLAGTVNATVLYDNLNSTYLSALSPIPGANGPLYDSFSTGSTGFNLVSVTLYLQQFYQPTAVPPGSFTTALYSDNSTSPGVKIQDIVSNYSDALVPFGVPAVLSFVTFTIPGNGIPLSAGTRYWLGLSTSDNSDISWNYSNTDYIIHDTYPIGVKNEYWSGYYYGTQIRSNNTYGPFMMQLSGDAVPIPGAVWLLGSGLLGLTGLRRFRKS